MLGKNNRLDDGSLQPLRRCKCGKLFRTQKAYCSRLCNSKYGKKKNRRARLLLPLGANARAQGGGTGHRVLKFKTKVTGTGSATIK